MSADRQRTTIAVSKQARDRLQSLKPYESMSYEEFMLDLARAYADDSDRHTIHR